MVVTTDETDVNGDYFFGNLPPGDYVVGILPLATLPLSSDEAADEDNPNADVDLNDNGIQAGGAGTPIYSNAVTLGGTTPEPIGAAEMGTGGAQDDATPTSDAFGNMTVDFGLFPGLSIGSVVFLDDNNNGMQDAGEAGIFNVPVNLVDPVTMNVITTVFTDVNGVYLFSGLQRAIIWCRFL